MYNHPGELISNYDTEQQYKNKDVIKLPGKPNNDKPIPGKPVEINHNPNEGKMSVINDSEHVRQALNELRALNAPTK